MKTTKTCLFRIFMNIKLEVEMKFENFKITMVTLAEMIKYDNK